MQSRNRVWLLDPAQAFGLLARRQPGLLCTMMNLRMVAKYWLPVLGWMGVIFSASGDRKSAQHSSRLIEPLVRWLFPHLTNDTIWLVVLFVRKCAHLTEYAILALLLWWALRASTGPRASSWSWSLARNTWLVVVIYAASDELHQWFVPDRQASGWDVLIDSSGAAAALVGLWALGRWRKWWFGGNKRSGPTP
jgi:VanZ family protein